MVTIKNPIREADIEKMFAHAAEIYPSECCGVIIGDLCDPEKTEIVPCKNIQHEMKEKFPDQFTRGADTGYFMDPKDVREAFDEASRRGDDVIGFYHSHPDHEVYWSKEDHRAAMWAGSDEPSFPDAINVVISVINGVAKDAGAFTWNPDTETFERFPLK